MQTNLLEHLLMKKNDTENCNGFVSFSDTVYVPKSELV